MAARSLQGLLRFVLSRIHSVDTADRHHFAQDIQQVGTGPRIATNHNDGLADRGGGAREPHQKHELPPRVVQDVAGELGLDATSEAGLQQCLTSRGSGPIELTEHQLLQGTCPANDARPVKGRGDLTDAVHDLRWAEGRLQVLVLQNTILGRKDRSARPDQWSDLLWRGHGVPEHHDIDDADDTRIVLAPTEAMWNGSGHSIRRPSVFMA